MIAMEVKCKLDVLFLWLSHEYICKVLYLLSMLELTEYTLVSQEVLLYTNKLNEYKILNI